MTNVTGSPPYWVGEHLASLGAIIFARPDLKKMAQKNLLRAPNPEPMQAFRPGGDPPPDLPIA